MKKNPSMNRHSSESRYRMSKNNINIDTTVELVTNHSFYSIEKFKALDIKTTSNKTKYPKSLSTMRGRSQVISKSKLQTNMEYVVLNTL